MTPYFASGQVSSIFFDRQRVNKRSWDFATNIPTKVRILAAKQALVLLAAYWGQANAIVFPVLFRRTEDLADFGENAELVAAQGKLRRPGSGATRV